MTMSNQPIAYDDAGGESDLRALHFANSSAAAAQVQRQLLQKSAHGEYLPPSSLSSAGVNDRLKYSPLHSVSRQDLGNNDSRAFVDRNPALQLTDTFKRPNDHTNLPSNSHLDSRPSFTNELPSQTHVEQAGVPRNVVGRVQTSRASHPEQFMRSLFDFMQRRGTPISSTPSVQGRQVNLVNLYASVMRAGGSQKITNGRMWNAIASHLGFSSDIFPDAPVEIATHFESYLAAYEEAWLKSQTNMHSRANSRSPDEDGAENTFPHSRRDGLGNSEQQAIPTNLQRDSWPLQGRQQSPERKLFKSSSPMYQNNAFTLPYDSLPTPSLKTSLSNRQTPTSVLPLKPGAAPISKNLQPKKRTLDTYGGLDVHLVAHHGRERERLRPAAPLLHELGLVDIHSLNMSLKCGLISETRIALNTLVTITADSRYEIELANCDDLLESILEVGHKILKELRIGSKRPDVHLHTYAELTERMRDEASTLMEPDHITAIHGGEAVTYDVDKFLCITTILRNLSFNESNTSKYNSDADVIIFIVDAIYACCCEPQLLKSTHAMLDVYKDFITILSNIAHGILITNYSQAYALLQLVVAFSPNLPWQSLQCRPKFNSFKPTEHPYLALALDTLAKLLARHVPNRKYIAEVFFSTGESSTSPPYAMFAKAFALSISALPESDDGFSFSTLEMRLPMLEQGMLASEVLVAMTPPLFAPLQYWVHSEDAFVGRVLRLVCTLSALNGSMARTNNMAVSDYESTPFSRVTRRGMMFLRELSTKTRNTSEATLKVIPSKESLLGALLTVSMDPFIVRQLSAFSEEDDEASETMQKTFPEL